jgi:hypothetical protein
VIFLGGLGRSGTTLLECLLGQVSGVQALGEVVHLWKRGIENAEKCGCGTPFPDCGFWRPVGNAAFGGWDQVDVEQVEALRGHVDRLRRVPRVIARPEPQVAEYADYYGRIYSAAAEVSGAQVLIDSSKHPSLAHCLRRLPNVDFRVIHVVRDPRAVANAWTKVVKRPDVATAGTGDEFMAQFSPAYAAALWAAENLAITSLGRLGVPVLRVRYEDLAATPEPVLRKAATFAGLAAGIELPVHGSEALLAPTHTASGNPIRFHNGPLSIRLDEAWRRDLGQRDRRVVSALTAPLAATYGYRGSKRAA